MHVQVVIEKADAARAEQEEIEELQQQGKKVQWEQEQAEKEAEYIQQVNAKEIDEARFWELVSELDLERTMGESIAEGPATTQDEEVGEREWDESVEEEPEVAKKVIESSTVSKGKWKMVPTRAKVYREVDGPVSDLLKSSSICTNTYAHSATGALHRRHS
jgi:hypothetical protein